MTIKAYLIGKVITSNSQEAFALYQKSTFGEPESKKTKSGKIQYTLSEALYLVENKKMEVFTSINSKKSLNFDKLMTKVRRIDKRIPLKYIAFKDLREKGYIVKTALKFGADFRVYEKGSRPGKTHAKWLVFVEHETARQSWHEFSAKNRVAHSTKKKLLIAIVDEESDVSYYEVHWIKT